MSAELQQRPKHHKTSCHVMSCFLIRLDFEFDHLQVLSFCSSCHGCLLFKTFAWKNRGSFCRSIDSDCTKPKLFSILTKVSNTHTHTQNKWLPQIKGKSNLYRVNTNTHTSMFRFLEYKGAVASIDSALRGKEKNQE